MTNEQSEDSDWVLYFFWIFFPVILFLLLPWTILGFLIVKSWTYKSEWAKQNQSYISIRSNERGRKYIIIPLIIYSILGTIVFAITIVPFLFIGGYPSGGEILLLLLCEWVIILIGPLFVKKIIMS